MPLSPNAFAGHTQRPTERELASVLGRADGLWQELIADLKRDLKLDGEEWNTYSIKAGWSLRLQLKKRNIVYLGPRSGCFLASFVLGDKAVAAARKSKLPQSVLKIIDVAKRYAEGTAVRIEVHKAGDANVVKTLAKIKIEN
ncbi:MAG: DUF3788 domain-containing protein [Candidatus Sulfotelmatobacter sp.]